MQPIFFLTSPDRTTSQSSSEESDDSASAPVTLKFVSKSKRTTVSLYESQEAEEKRQMEEKEVMKKKRREETRADVKDIIKKEKQLGGKDDITDDQADLAGLPEVNEEDEDYPDKTCQGYKDWEEREIMRLAEEILVRSRMKDDEKLKEEKKRLSKMTDEERLATDSDLRERVEESRKEKEAEKGSKPKPKFLQRYQHKGAFYMAEDELDAHDVRKKNYHLEARSSAVDISKLPEVMQKKNFGRKGNSKYTHMKDQDTGAMDTLDEAKRKRARRDSQK